nr:Protein of unknown function DUF862 domain containing protein [Haemonchus contortus]
MSRVPVRLNVYDMYWLNDYASNIGFGIFHSGIEVYGVEYAYGGHPYAFSGVFENSPQDAEELGENFKFRQCIVIGETAFSASAVRELIKSLGHEYRGDRYHLISRNCNHFSAVLAKALTGNDIPTWVNRLANLSGSIPFLERCLPQEWLTPVALQQSLDDQRNADRPRPCGNDAHKRLSIDSAEDALDAKLNDSRATVVSARGFSGYGPKLSQPWEEKFGLEATVFLCLNFGCSAKPPRWRFVGAE